MNLDSFKKIAPDYTQLALIEYLSDTENMMRQVIKKYDIDGDVQIIPAVDLGFPNNLYRINGGFATGIVINWKCNRPIVFIDATINSCVSSCYELSEHTDYHKFFNNECINDSINKQFRTPYRFNIDSGNHFIAICKSISCDKYYYVQHFSDSGAKHPEFGLYPNDQIWYRNRINVFKYNNRVLRYLLDEDAAFFYEKAKQTQEFTIKGHRLLVSQLIGEGNYSNEIIAPHYGMLDQNTIFIGCFVSMGLQVLPIFSDVGKPITLVKTVNDSFAFRTYNNTCFNIVPHGWGQKWKHEGRLLIRSNGNNVVVDENGKVLQWDTTQKSSDFQSYLKVRDTSPFQKQTKSLISTFHTIDTLLQVAAYINGEKGVEYYG